MHAPAQPADAFAEEYPNTHRHTRPRTHALRARTHVVQAGFRILCYMPFKEIYKDVFVWLDVLTVIPFWIRYIGFPQTYELQRYPPPPPIHLLDRTTLSPTHTGTTAITLRYSLYPPSSHLKPALPTPIFIPLRRYLELEEHAAFIRVAYAFSSFRLLKLCRYYQVSQ